MRNTQYYAGGILEALFPSWVKLAPNTNQLWELDIARGELETLNTRQALIQRSAFFGMVGGKPTNHFRLCEVSPLQVDRRSSVRRQTFFETNQFKTGYATHGLFPYRGKFHPQLVKGIMNIIRLGPGDTVLDPMGGSGTVAIEAAINAINSISVDISPFCTLMTSAKTHALSVPPQDLKGAFAGEERGLQAKSARHATVGGLFQSNPQEMPSIGATMCEQSEGVAEILALATMDAAGYAERRVNKTGSELFPVIAERYLAAISTFQKVSKDLGLTLGSVDARTGDARSLDIPDNSIDGIITSPPYSFAIDYAENDRSHIERLGCNVDELKSQMIGLIGGKSIAKRVEAYFTDMKSIFREMYRVLRPGKCCVVVIGSNEIQTGGIRHEIQFALDAKELGFDLYWNMVRPIQGIMNSMRDEYVMFFRKPA